MDEFYARANMMHPDVSASDKDARIASLEAQLAEREEKLGKALYWATDMKARAESAESALAAAREENERLQKESCLHMATADAMLSLQNPNIKDEIIDSFANQLMQNFRVVSFARMVCKEQKKITTLSADPITLAVFKLIDAIEYLDEQKEEYFRLPIDPKFREQLDMSLELQIAEGKLEKAESELAALRSRADDAGCAACEVQSASGSTHGREHTCADDAGRVERVAAAIRSTIWGAVRFDDDRNINADDARDLARAVLAAADGR